jgi:hypothetical protein
VGAVDGSDDVTKMMRKMMRATLLSAGVLALAGCPTTPTPTCTPQSCANGCCTASGQCVTAHDVAACGLNGATCAQCSNDQLCASGVCTSAGTGGGGGGDAGSAGGGGATGGGSGGGSALLPDGGVDCDATSYDAVLGTLRLSAGATVTASAPLPAGVLTVAPMGATLYGLFDDKTVRPLGSLPSLAVGAPLGTVVTPADVAADAGVFLGGSLAVSGTQLLAGYTKPGAGFPGAVARFETADGGVEHFDAPGNYTLAGLPSGFLINGQGVGGAGSAGVWALDAQGGFLLASFEAAWQAANGFTARTANGVLLLGYFNGSDFKNYLVGVPSSRYAGPLASRTSFALSQGNELLSGDDVADVTALGNDAVVVRGGYLFDPPYSAYTKRVERLPLAVSGSGTQTVTAGAPVTLVNAPDLCTRVVFAVGAGASLLLGVEDKHGRRLVQLQP